MRKCIQCGVEFKPNSGKQRYCSDKCKMAHSRAAKALGGVPSAVELPANALDVGTKEYVHDQDADGQITLHEVSEIEAVDPAVTVVSPEGELKKQASAQAVARTDDVIAGLNKRFGPGTIMRLGDAPPRVTDVISTGSLGLDRAVGIGGLPRGRIVEIIGPESSGKTTIALHVIAEAQSAGLNAGFVDAEHAFDVDYARAIGVDVDRLELCQPDSGEQGLEVVDALVQSRKYGVVVVDSVAALVPQSELEGEMGDSKMGLQARLMSQACRKLAAVVNKSNTLVIFINQIRQKIGVVWGNPETTPGGNALKFYASVRLDVRNLGKEGTAGDYTGNRTKVTVIKNKCAPPFKVAEFGIVYGEGIDRFGEAIDLAEAKKVVHKNGSWYSYHEMKLGQGRAAARAILMDNPELFEEIKSKLIV